MPVMDVGHMRMFMFEIIVFMDMRMLSNKSVFVNMIMMKIIMAVLMIMLHIFMRMDVLMFFSDDKNCADYHYRK